MKSRAILVLEDGKHFFGSSFGYPGEAFGEVVFNTSMMGYQEILTDPSYFGQLITMTYPLIGNYGINDEDMESPKPSTGGLIVREYSKYYSNWRATASLQDFLTRFGVVGIEGVDTRALTRHIRSAGAMRGVISTESSDLKELTEMVKAHPSFVGKDLIKNVATKNRYTYHEGVDSLFKVAAIDFGMKRSILDYLVQAGCSVDVLPPTTTSDEVLRGSYDGIFLSNGPGDPKGVTYAIETLKSLIGKRPIFGICLGHQLLSLALGGDTFKLKFGHRGGNHPVKFLETGRVEITSQNHGFVVDKDSFSKGGDGSTSSHGPVEITHINLNDQTVEGIRCNGAHAFSVQYHPEAAPGPHDSKYLFDDFMKEMREFKRQKT
ncbi:MAG: glutamine-hydrolyzing carbamoyl-phosphate synthase small subunit [Actinomycetota bacterium]|nr:glutamine-hydrolyzing carbamoyl-phosphate synthase small subunit [Actinomycetota bacterium]